MTWTACECGCGHEGPDELVEWLIQDAVMERLNIEELLRKSRAAEGLPVEPADEFEAQQIAHAALMAKHRSHTGAA